MSYMVLLSGGLDSVAALLWSIENVCRVEALFCDYGQPARDRELESAKGACVATGTVLHECDVRSAYTGSSAGLFTPGDAMVRAGLDTAFVPCRNIVLLSLAAARALQRWPNGMVTVVAGFNSHDGSGFPDCSHVFVEALEYAINAGIGESSRVRVCAPWLGHTKSEIVDWVKATTGREHLLRQSWSCYRSDGPCGTCTACVVRGKSGL